MKNNIFKIGSAILILSILLSSCGLDEALDAFDKGIDKAFDKLTEQDVTQGGKYDTLSVNGFDITLKDVKKATDIEPTSNDYVIACEFEIKNNNSSEKTISDFDFSGYADDIAIDTEYFGSSKYQSINATISTGKSCVGWVLFDVPNSADEIIIDFAPDDIARFSFDL